MFSYGDKWNCAIPPGPPDGPTNPGTAPRVISFIIPAIPKQPSSPLPCSPSAPPHQEQFTMQLRPRMMLKKPLSHAMMVFCCVRHDGALQMLPDRQHSLK